MSRTVQTELLKLVLSALWIALVAWTIRDTLQKPVASQAAVEVRR